MTLPEVFKVLIITLSDRASKGEYNDLSGPAVMGHVRKVMTSSGWQSEIKSVIIPDDAGRLRVLMEDADNFDLIITTGGTGIGPRDITVDVIRPMLTKEIPGIMELIRVKYGTKNPGALISRAVAGVIGKTLVYTLPGSEKAVHEYMSEIDQTMKHTFYMLWGIDKHK